MDKQRIGGVFLSASCLIGPLAADMMGLTIPAPLGWFLIGLCVAGFLVGAFMAWPRSVVARSSSEPPPKAHAVTADEPEQPAASERIIKEVEHQLLRRSAHKYASQQVFDLMQRVAGKTDHQASLLTRKLEGLRLTIRGQVISVIPGVGFSVLTVALDGDLIASASLLFTEDLDALGAIHKYEIVTVAGLVERIREREIVLRDCRLV